MASNDIAGASFGTFWVIEPNPTVEQLAKDVIERQGFAGTDAQSRASTLASEIRRVRADRLRASCSGWPDDRSGDNDAMIGRRYAVLYLKNGRELRSPWFLRSSTAQTALQIMRQKHGSAIIYVD